MAGKPKPMSQIKQLLQLHKQGKGKKHIANVLGVSKNTVKSYLSKIENGQLDIDELLSLEDPTLETKFFAGNPAYKEERYESLKNNLSYYVNELNKTGVTRQLLWEEYIETNPTGYKKTQFYHHLRQYENSSKPTMVLKHIAGEKLYIDFAGKKLSYVDKTTGEVIECQVFVACLPYSDYSFAMAVRSQCIEDFIFALSCCLKDIGGVPQTIVPDNLKSAVIKSSRYEPTINRALEDFANHYNTTITPTRSYKPRDKALVENQVSLIYSRVYAKLRNQIFFDLPSLNKAIKEKILHHNQTRMQQKDYCREEKFQAEEKHKLKQLPQSDYEVKYYNELTVAKNNHIYLGNDKHYYSVPYIYTGQKVKVIFTRSYVSVYYKGKQIARHARDYVKGAYTTVREHLCSNHKHYMDRSPEYYINRTKGKSENFGLLIKIIFGQDKYPEHMYKTCDGLFNLERKTDRDIFDKACMIAIQHNCYSYRFIDNLIANNMVKLYTENEPAEDKPVNNPNTRGKGYYN